MRRNMLVAGLMTCGMAAFSPVPAEAAGRVTLAGTVDQPDMTHPPAEGNWLQDENENLTIPLGPYWMTPWPPDFCRVFGPALTKCGP
jgi:hypothetical protein